LVLANQYRLPRAATYKSELLSGFLAAAIASAVSPPGSLSSDGAGGMVGSIAL
jgi:hypothetical protein